jgi:hypothetical protein
VVVGGLCRHWSKLFIKVAECASFSQALMLLVVAGCAGIGQRGSERLRNLLAAVMLKCLLVVADCELLSGS